MGFLRHELADGRPLSAWPRLSGFIYLFFTALFPSLPSTCAPPSCPSQEVQPSLAALAIMRQTVRGFSASTMNAWINVSSLSQARFSQNLHPVFYNLHISDVWITVFQFYEQYICKIAALHPLHSAIPGLLSICQKMLEKSAVTIYQNRWNVFNLLVLWDRQTKPPKYIEITVK